MKQTTKEWVYILCLFIISILFFINDIDETFKAIIIVAIFLFVIILKFLIKDSDH